MNSPTAQSLFTQDEIAPLLGKSIAWLERARWAGNGPRFVKIGRSVRYRHEDILAWIEAQTRSSTREAR